MKFNENVTKYSVPKRPYGAKRKEILYRNFVANCKANPAVCLHGTEIGSIDLPNSKTYKLKNSHFAYFLKNPNPSWLRSFHFAWGLGEKMVMIPLFIFFCEHKLPKIGHKFS